jgi:hypothetical protein
VCNPLGYAASHGQLYKRTSGLHSHARAGAKTCLDVCFTEFKYQNLFKTIGTLLGSAEKKVLYSSSNALLIFYVFF